MSNKYEGLTAKEADDLLVGTIGGIVCEELSIARRMTPEEWDELDIFRWSHEVASGIYYAIENRRRGAP
ncbi:hypothetical protein HB772_09050 [Sinorhizobium meliloti]|nr:hypothetical protein HB772_09050 [Sinorhizobium meliloti]